MRALTGEELWEIMVGVDCRERDKWKGEQGMGRGQGDGSGKME